jgi:hypothetical protein
MVYVLSVSKKPLMPCSNVIARLLLKQGKAKCIKKTPFTIKLLQETTSYVQELTLGIDTGSKIIGSAVYDLEKRNIIYISEIEVRNDISKKMKQRSKYRRNRRNRKTRYREARWLNRKNSIRKDRFSPTMVSKINSHLKEINFVKSILPIKNIILETGNFDIHRLKNPNINKWEYQKGDLYGYSNIRELVLTRDKYVCQNCKGKLKDSKLEIHHIIFRSKGGSDASENLITLCKTCHDDLHKGKISLANNGKVKTSLKHATQMNSIRVQLLKLLPEATETFGYITKQNRWELGLSKEHYNDAITIACRGLSVNNVISTILYKKCINDGDYQLSKGIRSEQKIPTGKIQGFRKFDKVRYLNSEYFIKGRMSAGYAILMDIKGTKIPLKPIPKFVKMKRIQARKTWIMSQKIIQNIA